MIQPNIKFLKQQQLTEGLIAFIEAKTDLNINNIGQIENQNKGDYKSDNELPKSFKDYVYVMDKYIFDTFYPKRNLN